MPGSGGKGMPQTTSLKSRAGGEFPKHSWETGVGTPSAAHCLPSDALGGNWRWREEEEQYQEQGDHRTVWVGTDLQRSSSPNPAISRAASSWLSSFIVKPSLTWSRSTSLPSLGTWEGFLPFPFPVPQSLIHLNTSCLWLAIPRAAQVMQAFY